MIFIWEIYWPGKVIVKIACCDLFSLPANSTRRRIVKVLHNKFINIHWVSDANKPQQNCEVYQWKTSITASLAGIHPYLDRRCSYLILLGLIFTKFLHDCEVKNRNQSIVP